MELENFEELNLSEAVIRAIQDHGFTKPTPIQAEAIPVALSGKDIIGQAQTGTGKTAAFGIPLLERINPDEKNTQVLVMCPTRELALQVSEELKKLAKYTRTSIGAVYGGEPIDKQIRSLSRGLQIVVGTPGRIIDHINRKTLSLSTVTAVVLDEADEMLNMGFRDDIEEILKTVPKSRQTLLFSATMPDAIMALTHKYQRDPVLIKLVRNKLTVNTIEQVFFEVKSSLKMEIMRRLIELYDFKLMLVFCNKKSKTDEVAETLKAAGFSAEALHGDMRQASRNLTLSKFRSGAVNVLVATDVAARGLDVENVDAVFNFDIPQDVEFYVHRIGRTGRAGKFGKAFSFVTGRREMDSIREIQRVTGVKIDKGTIPGKDELQKIRKKKFSAHILDLQAKGILEPYYTILKELEEDGFSVNDIAAAYLEQHFSIKDIVEVEQPRGDRDRGDRGDRGRDRDRGDRGRDRDRRDSRSDSRSDRGDRGDRGRDRDRGKDKSRSRGKMVRLFINVGTQDKVRPGDIVGSLAGNTNISGNDIGVIEIFDKFSFVEIPENSVEVVLAGMENKPMKGRKISIEVAKV
jgi:ATP-dependent RNA helicase DeaD